MNVHLRLAVLVVALQAVGCAGLGGAVRHPDSPEAWRHYWSKQHQDDMASASLGPAHVVGRGQTVLLVPGMTIGQEMFDTMARRLQRDGFSPVAYQDTALLTDGVIPSARRLAERVEQVVAATGEERIDIVAECVGGVVASYYVRVLGGDKRVAHLITFVSPHHGSLPAGIAAAVTGWQGLRDIRRDSSVVLDVERHPLSSAVQLTSIYSCHDMLLLPHDTAAIPGARNLELCGYPLDHFAGFWRAVYGLITDALTDQDSDADSRVSRLNARHGLL